jgi:NAD(P)-dependent dehydrogenase (short-subunit alcohol dehydrogenase family)
MARLLEGKVILVTGAAGGIGYQTSRVLSAHGARLVVTDVNKPGGEALLADLLAEGGEAIFQAADLAQEEDVEQLVASAIRHFGQLDGAFNNAGIEQKNKPLDELTLDEWEQALRIDLTAVFLCIKYQVKAMLQDARGGAIVNTASSLGQVAIPCASEYVAAKHGVVGLTRAATRHCQNTAYRTADGRTLVRGDQRQAAGASSHRKVRRT